MSNLDSLVARYDTAVPRYTSYPPAPLWSAAVKAPQHALALQGAAAHAGPLSLYVHVPFCRTLCSYCGCNVVVGKKSRDVDAFIDDVALEIAHASRLLGDRRSVAQLHWGGGTPTFLQPDQLTRLWIALFERFRLLPEYEAAIEVNPATCTLAQLEQLRALGFNRISFGVQDLDPAVQRAVRRPNVGPRLGELFAVARALGFKGINFDLIYGLPEQSPQSWEATLNAVLELRPDRLAVYAFAFLPELLPHQRALDAAALPVGSAKLALFRQAFERLTGAGYLAIGLDHFAVPDDELAIAQQRRVLRRNFQGYTAARAGDVVAFGPSAISDVEGLYAQNVRELGAYQQEIRRGCLATVRGHRLTPDERRRRAVIEQLMCNLWADLGPDGSARFAPELDRLRGFVDDGLVEVRGAEVQVTEAGRLFIRNIASVFDASYQPAPERMASAI